MKKLIDANVILRYLLGDSQEMSEKAKLIIEEGAYTIPEVLAEVVYVLKGVYHINRYEICDTLVELLDEIEIEHSEVIKYSLKLFASSSLDFVDCVLIARNKLLKEKVFTFDLKLNKYLLA